MYYYWILVFPKNIHRKMFRFKVVSEQKVGWRQKLSVIKAFMIRFGQTYGASGQ